MAERLEIRVKRSLDRFTSLECKLQHDGNVVPEGYNPDRVTDIQNAVEAPKRALDPVELDTVRQELGLGENSVVGLFCGHMYPQRRLGRLVAAAKLVHKEIPWFKTS